MSLMETFFLCDTKIQDRTTLKTLYVVPVEAYETFVNHQSLWVKQYLQSLIQTSPNALDVFSLPSQQGGIDGAVVFVDPNEMWMLGQLTTKLPVYDYQIDQTFHSINTDLPYLSFGLGGYQFTKYQSQKANSARARLVLPEAYWDSVRRAMEAIYLVRDLVNTPSMDLGPEQLADVAKTISQHYQADYHVITGQDLLEHNYPAIYHVGKAGSQAPRLIELTWGDPNHPTVGLVGKGVCFDTGGVNLKPPEGMLHMHKDMGGAAHVLALAQWIMDAQLPIRLKVYIPAVDNGIDRHAYKPSDILTMRNGKTVEVTNTDAEGRLVLADALTAACEHKLDYLFDFATLTGAARVALGPEIGAFYCNDQGLARKVLRMSQNCHDPICQLPLYAPYRDYLKSRTADLINAPRTPYAGSMTAALFLQYFVGHVRWGHFDIMAWNTRNLPGRLEGAEALGIRAMFQFLAEEFDN